MTQTYPTTLINGNVVKPNGIIGGQNQFNVGGMFQLTGYIQEVITPLNISTNLPEQLLIYPHLANVVVASMTTVSNGITLPADVQQFSNIVIQNNSPSVITVDASMPIQYYGTNMGNDIDLKPFYNYRFVLNPATNGWLCLEEGSSEIQTHRTTITSAQLLEISGNPIIVLPATLSSGDVFVQPMSCSVKSSSGTPYDTTGMSGLAIKAGSFTFFEDNLFENLVNPGYASTWAYYTGQTLLNGDALYLESDADPTLGDLDIEVTITYKKIHFTV